MLPYYRGIELMKKQMNDFFPPPEELLSLEPEEGAVFLLDYLCELEKEKSKGLLNRYNFTLRGNIHPYATDKTEQVAKAMMEAWVWLEKEGMIAPLPGEDTGNWFFVTRRGFRLQERANLEAYKKGKFLPKDNLDEVLVRKVYPLFIKGDYDTAVFQAFKEVEIRVREKVGLGNELYGIDLMRKAFDPQIGKLTDKQALSAEKEAKSHLFAGSIGLFKNPSSHREVNYDDPQEAAELILFANYLLRLTSRGSEEKK